MLPETYCRAKLVDGWLQVAVIPMTMLGFRATAHYEWAETMLLSYPIVGGTQVLSWLLWLFLTPPGHRISGRRIYPVIMIPILILWTLCYASTMADYCPDSLTEARSNLMFFLIFGTPFLAIYYTALTFNESARHNAAESGFLDPQSVHPE